MNKDIEFDAAALGKNTRALDYSKATCSSIAGALAGILGLTNSAGFILYLAAQVWITGLVWLIHCRTSPFLPVFNKNVAGVFFFGLFENLLGFIMFWTLFYGIIYVYE